MYCVFSTCAGETVYVSLCGEGGSKRCDEEVREAITVVPGATSKVEFVATGRGQRTWYRVRLYPCAASAAWYSLEAANVELGEARPLRSFGRLV